MKNSLFIQPRHSNTQRIEWIKPSATILSLLVVPFAWCASANVAAQQIALVGTWTSIPDAPLVQKPVQASDGLYQLQMNEDGTLTPTHVFKMKSPSWIVKSKDGRFAYTTNEENKGEVTAISVQSNQVKVLNTVDSHGGHPTHASISLDNKFLVVSNYSAIDKDRGGVTVFPILPNGHLGEKIQNIVFSEGSNVVKGRQDSGHAHSTTFSQMVSIYMRPIWAMTKYTPFNITPIRPSRSRQILAEM